MHYCTFDEIIKKRIPENVLMQLTDDDDMGAVDMDIVDSIIAEQDELINGYLRKVFAVPLNPVPGIVTTIALDLCAYAFYQRRAHVEPPEKIVTGYNAAIKRLLDIQAGKIDLNVSTDDVVSGSADTAAISAADQIFSGDSLANF